MNYETIYLNLIEKAKNRSILPTEYKENHHILPKCMGGTDDEQNIVPLFAREHYIAHLLLIKIYPKNNMLLRAVFKMSKQCELSGYSYEWARKRFSSMMKTSKNPMSKKNPKSAENRLKLSARQTENNVATRPEVKKKISAAKKKYFETHSSNLKGKRATIETRMKQSEAAKKRTGKNATRKKRFNLVSPDGTKFYCEGTLGKTAKMLNLTLTILNKYRGNVVPVEYRKAYNTQRRNNTTGWMLEEL